MKERTLTKETLYDHSQPKCLWPRHWCLFTPLWCLATDWTHVMSSVNLPLGLNALFFQPLSRDLETNLLKCPWAEPVWRGALIAKHFISYLIFVVCMLFNLLNSLFINCNSVSFAESVRYLISLANMPLSEALGLSNTTKLFNHLILLSTLSHRFCYWPFTLQGEWHQPWLEHFK